MKKFIVFIALFSFVLLFSIENHCKNFPEIQKKKIVRSLVNGIDSENVGLKVSAALRVFEFIQQGYLTRSDFSTAVIPLMKMLREGKSEIERIAAALSLYEIEDGRGIYSLCGTAKFDDSERVRNISKNLYYQHHINKGTTYLVRY
ncbi:MAG: hypothetical protein R6W90_02510 [Ignavibacteriaceae bacterium]